MSESRLSRREWLAAVAAAAGVTLAASSRLHAFALPDAAPRITVYKDPDCGCCKAWVSHLSASGFAVTAHDRGDMDALKDSLGVPSGLRSCHTAVIGKYVVEGHVPAADIKRLLATRPKDVVGLAVPGMPAGSPGMEVGSRRDAYDVMAFGGKGAPRVFAHHA